LRKVRSGFEQWFTSVEREGGAPLSIWKMNMIVLMVLYPTVFLFGFFVGTPLLASHGVPGWLGLFIGNIFSTVMLGYYFTPWAARRLTWWLSPKAPSSQIDLAGAGVVVLIYGLCLLAFSQFP
jgi:hypothetical protein